MTVVVLPPIGDAKGAMRTIAKAHLRTTSSLLRTRAQRAQIALMMFGRDLKNVIDGEVEDLTR